MNRSPDYPFEMPWRNSRFRMYEQTAILDELPRGHLKSFLSKYGCCFDDYWYYWKSKKSNRIYRAPLVLWGFKFEKDRIPTEKHKWKIPSQRKLKEFP